ncbi:MAG: 4Fe-4S binding protein [Candidatus Methanomethylophilaceae archaeon]|nr:4Fe-4S binding protein [Candidatus Methanomethylophilaceae archaeon]MDD4119628.1 4Fe-4S binding protein [Candidatus Methanomethylophilaceae archaeon]
MTEDDGLINKIREIWPGFAVADAAAWDTDPLVSATIPTHQRPRSIMPSARSVVVIWVPVSPTIMHTAPSIYYREHYRTLNTLLDVTSQRIATMLDAEGHDAAYVPRDGYHGIEGLRKDPSSFFSHRHAAYLAGLGTFGINNVLLTEKHGPRVRFASVITSADIPAGRPLKKGLCTECMKCVRECPANALSGNTYPGGLDKSLCVERSGELAKKGISPCGRCIAVCPVGKKVKPPSDDFIEAVRRYEI